MRHSIDFDLMHEIAQTIYCCSWESEDEIYEYIKAVTIESNESEITEVKDND